MSCTHTREVPMGQSMLRGPADPDNLYPTLDEQDICRICLESDTPSDDPLIAPCRCSGYSKWVHRRCLDEWRSQEQVPLAFSHCPTCKFQYRTEVTGGGGALVVRRVKLVLFVARDTIGLFIVLQAGIALLALLLHAMDTHEAIVRLYPDEWATVHAAARLSIGPYYVTTSLGLLAIVGFGSLTAYCTGSLPSQMTAARHPARWRRPNRGGCCDGGCGGGGCADDCFWCWYCNNVQCRCDNCPACGGAGGCDGDGAKIVAVVGLALLVVFILVGLVGPPAAV